MPVVFRNFVICLGAVIVSSVWAHSDPAIAQAQVQRPSLGLVLSGGGARGFAHIGALQALEELRIPFDVVTATSMGAMVGGGFAAGMTPEEIRKVTLSVNWTRMFAPRADRQKLTWREKLDDRAGLGAGELGWGPKGLSLPSQVVPSQELDMFLTRVNQPVSSVNNLSELTIPFAAVSTDLETGERVVLNDDITLSLAMRASMSIPGAFAPVHYKGHMLVDGGLVDNLPVNEARKMGAQIVVAINVGTPLSKRDKLNNVVGIMGQMINLLTEQNVQTSIRSLGKDDIYIVPELGNLTSGDFMRAQDIMKRGYDAVMKVKDKLLPYAVSKEQYAAWAQRRAVRSSENADHVLSGVRVEGLKTVNPDRVLAEVKIDTSKPVSDNQIEDVARDIWATGDFQSVPFRFEAGPRGTEVLVFTPAEKEWGYSSLRFGGNLQTDFQSANTFNVLFAHTWGWLNDWGGQWRNEAQMGEFKRAATEWYQPLGDAGNWFVKPCVSYEWEPFDVYLPQGNSPVSRYRNERFNIGLNLGYEIGRMGRVEGMVGWLDNKTKMEIGLNEVQAKAKAYYAGLSFGIDTLDNPSFPRKGMALRLSAYRVMNPTLQRMNSLDDIMYSAEAALPVVLGKRTTLLMTAKTGQTPQAGSFKLGGVFNLSGSPYGRFSGNRMDLGRAMLFYDVSRVMREMHMPVYLGASFEVGRAWDEDNYVHEWSHDKAWQRAASIFVGTDSWIGPVYLVAGRTFGEGSAVTLYWGHLH